MLLLNGLVQLHTLCIQNTHRQGGRHNRDEQQHSSVYVAPLIHLKAQLDELQSTPG